MTRIGAAKGAPDRSPGRHVGTRATGSGRRETDARTTRPVPGIGVWQSPRLNDLKGDFCDRDMQRLMGSIMGI